jgi:hypothetical protein
MSRKVIHRRRFTLDLPDYLRIAKDLIRGYMPRAGEQIERRARGRLGTYTAPGFPSWPRLAASTLRRKRGSLRRMRPGRRVVQRMFGAEAPLIDTGAMMRSIAARVVSGNRVSVSVLWPAEIHEQDPLMQPIAASVHTPPQRAFLGPALEASIPPIIEELENLMGARL